VKVEIPLSQYEQIMRLLDEWGIPESYGRDRVRSMIRGRTTGWRNDLLQAAIVQRRNRARKLFVPDQGTVPDEGTDECPF
jgi:hypothetical protein